MKVGVGFSEATDTELAGVRAAKRAMEQAGRDTPCDLVLLFSTAFHDPAYLQSSVQSVLGDRAVVVGGGAVGAISNDRFGYAGEQVGLAAFWLEGAGFDLFTRGGIVGKELAIGYRLGKRLAEHKATLDTPSILFYDAIDRSRGEVRLNLATPLLRGIEKGLGFLPAGLIGAGLQGDYDSTPTLQWSGGPGPEAEQAMVLTFRNGIDIDSAIMHGCRPYGKTYTVTRAEGQTILEIDGQPALSYIESQMIPSLPGEEFPFFMIFGINRGPTNEYDEKYYANRLCLAIDRARDGIVMFESDMVPGTEFQIMYRNLNLDYIPPKIDQLFEKVDAAGRKPVFAFYIDCAGRAASYGGEVEDAVVVQKAVANRAPLLGIYSGVEIAPIMGKPRTLDWTGVFSLFTTPK